MREREKVLLSQKNQKNIREQMSRARMMLKQNEITNDVGLDALARRVGRAVGLSISSTGLFTKKIQHSSSRLKTKARRAATGSAFFRASSCGAIEFTATVVATSLSISTVEELFPLRFSERNWRFDGDVVRF